MDKRQSLVNDLEMMGYKVQIIDEGILIYFSAVELELVKLIKNPEIETMFILQSIVLEMNQTLMGVHGGERL